MGSLYWGRYRLARLEQGKIVAIGETTFRRSTEQWKETHRVEVVLTEEIRKGCRLFVTM